MGRSSSQIVTADLLSNAVDIDIDSATYVFALDRTLDVKPLSVQL